jgi:hypothetical protein
MEHYGIGGKSFIVSLLDRSNKVREKKRGYSRLFSWDLGMRLQNSAGNNICKET